MARRRTQRRRRTRRRGGVPFKDKQYVPPIAYWNNAMKTVKRGVNSVLNVRDSFNKGVSDIQDNGSALYHAVKHNYDQYFPVTMEKKVLKNRIPLEKYLTHFILNGGMDGIDESTLQEIKYNIFESMKENGRVPDEMYDFIAFMESEYKRTQGDPYFNHTVKHYLSKFLAAAVNK